MGSRSSKAHLQLEPENRPSPDLMPLLTLPEVADILRTSEKTVRRLVAAQQLPCLRLGRQLRFIPADVFRWLSARKE